MKKIRSAKRALRTPLELSWQKPADLVSAAKILRSGGVGILPTDTLYGQVGSALSPRTVQNIYRLRRRSLNKPFIILISSPNEIKKFFVRPDDASKRYLNKFWPGKVSIVLPCKDPKWKFLHRGTKTLAFRVPKDSRLLKVLRLSGPLVAPSANFQGQMPPYTIGQARQNFGDKMDFYLNGGKRKTKPSTLIKIEEGKPVVLRQGAVKIK